MTDRRGSEEERPGGPVHAAAALPLTPSRGLGFAPGDRELLSATLSSGSEAELSFERRGDRWGYTLSLIASGGRRCVLVASVEGTPEQAWPPSPPLQALDRQTLADGRAVALLVGMAGRSHWSASVELDAARGAIRFDLACRHPAHPEWIGSTCHLTEAALAHLKLSPLAGTQVEVTRAPRAGWAGQLRAWPAEVAPLGGTARWGYELRLCPVPTAAGEPNVSNDQPARGAAPPPGPSAPHAPADR